MENLVCPCGKKSKEINTSNVGEREAQTGFTPIFTNESILVWLCDDCFPKAHKLAKELFEIIKNKHIYFPNLLK